MIRRIYRRTFHVEVTEAALPNYHPEILEVELPEAFEMALTRELRVPHPMLFSVDFHAVFSSIEVDVGDLCRGIKSEFINRVYRFWRYTRNLRDDFSSHVFGTSLPELI